MRLDFEKKVVNGARILVNPRRKVARNEKLDSEVGLKDAGKKISTRFSVE